MWVHRLAYGVVSVRENLGADYPEKDKIGRELAALGTVRNRKL